MFDYKSIFRNRELRLKLIQLLRFIPDRPYLKLVYWLKTGKHLNLDNPVGFNEKLNWLKLNRIHPEYTVLADKVAVREYIRNKIGEQYLFPLLGTWEKFSDIEFDKLPEKFVLKCNHDSGSVKIVEKATLTKEKLRELDKFFTGRLNENSYFNGREYPYKDIKPCILAEKFMESPSQQGGINDYKFLCFSGVPKLLLIISNRFEGEKHEDYFDMDFNWHPEIRKEGKSSDTPPHKPPCFESMKELAQKLSQGMETVRMDFYEVDGKVYFGEFTFFAAGGFYLFKPDEWEKKLGDWINIK